MPESNGNGHGKDAREVVERAVYDEALSTLKGVITIARNEQLVQGTYLTARINNMDLHKQGAICNGQSACFIGSMAMASNEVEKTPWGTTGLVDIPYEFTDEENREEYIMTRPGLKLAYEQANAAACRYVDKHNLKFDFDRENAAESLFEQGTSRTSYEGRRDVVIAICENAIRAICRLRKKQQVKELVSV